MSQNLKIAKMEIERYLGHISGEAPKLEALRDLLRLEAQRQRVDIDVSGPIVASGHKGEVDIAPNDFVYFRNDIVEGKPLSLEYWKAPEHTGEVSHVERLVA